MIYFLTGAIGTGKTTYCVDQLIKADAENNKHIKNGEPEKVRNIYSNISGLKVTHEPLPDDWRDTPEGSIIAIDECHKIEIYQPSRKVLHHDPRIVALNESRHTGYDFYFITQSPKFLHQHIRGLVNQHFHFHNPMGLEVATVFMWRHGNTLNPDAQNSKSLAENEFIYTFKKNVQNSFKSIEDGATHTKKRNIPKKVIYWSLAPVVLLCAMGYLLMKPETTGNLTGETFLNKTKSEAQKAEQSVQAVAQPTSQNNLDIECRKGINVEKPECVEWFNNLSKNNSSVASTGSVVQAVSYDSSKPYDFYYQPQVTPTDFPRMSGVVKLSSGKLMALDQQGNYMQNVSQQDCQKWLSGYRPFNYFAQSQNSQRERSVPEQQPSAL